MRQVSEVLRLRAEGLSLRQIGRSLGIGVTTAHEYLWRASAAGLEWPLPEGLDAEELEARLFRLEESGPHTTRPEPDWLEVHKELRRGKHVTLRLLWLEYRRERPEGWGYTQFCVRYRRWQGRQDVVMRQEHPGGERVFVDFCGDTVPVTDPETGEVYEAQIFVAVLGASGYLYAEAVRRQDLESWLGLHVRALEFFGGVTRVLVPDNLKAGVTKACWYEPELNPSYLELARYYGTVILPTRPRHPRDKVLAFDCTSSAGFDTSGLGALIVEPVVCDRGRAATRTLPGHPHPASGRAAVPCRCRRPRRGGRPAASA